MGRVSLCLGDKVRAKSTSLGTAGAAGGYGILGTWVLLVEEEKSFPSKCFSNGRWATLS